MLGKEGAAALVHFVGFYPYTCIILNAMDASAPRGEAQDIPFFKVLYFLVTVQATVSIPEKRHKVQYAGSEAPMTSNCARGCTQRRTAQQ